MIPLPSQIVAVSDTFDLLLNPADGGQRASVSEALDALEKESGKRFDPVVVESPRRNY
ncbi:MAG: hypothetical protein MPW15_19530 [Candidatus Manganitrophus sp.]|nr:hypothetical protein [Candidatus Manganitrophus sp.]